MEEELEYELIDIKFDFAYDLPEETGYFVHDDGPEVKEESRIEYDANGIPMGNSHEEIEMRRHIISTFYHQWKERNPEQRKYNKSLKEDINIRFVSITETCTHACRSYQSTLAALQLDTILSEAKKVETIDAKKNSNQKPFDKMIVMKYDFKDIGAVRMTVGIKRRTHEKVQYCITVPDSNKKEADNSK